MMTTPNTFFVEIGSGRVGSVIGSGGATIALLQEKHQCRLAISKGSARVIISSSVLTPSSIGPLLQDIADATGHLVHLNTFLYVCRVAIAASAVPAVIGRGGENIKALNSRGGAHVEVDRNTAQVVVTGTHKEIDDAIDAITQIIGRDRILSRDHNLSRLCPEDPPVPPLSPSTSTSAPPSLSSSSSSSQHSQTPQPLAPLVLHAAREKEIDEVLFFPETEESGSANFFRFLHYLRSARSTIDVCVFTITDDRIANALLDSHARGVRISIITDDNQAETLGSDVVRLAQAGIAVVVDNSKFLMHNKFAILDNTVLTTGSYNWTRAADRENNENIIITNRSVLVAPFIAQFARLWKMFQNNKIVGSSKKI